MPHARRAGRTSWRRGGRTFLSGVKEKYQKKHAKKGYANRKGYALIYLDIARIFFFPKQYHQTLFLFALRAQRGRRANIAG